MKLTLAMGLQYDNGKEPSMVALSLGQDKAPTGMKREEAVKHGLFRAVASQSSVNPRPSVESILSKENDAPFFLTYNVKGLSDTLIFNHVLLDVFV